MSHLTSAMRQRVDIGDTGKPIRWDGPCPTAPSKAAAELTFRLPGSFFHDASKISAAATCGLETSLWAGIGRRMRIIPDLRFGRSRRARLIEPAQPVWQRGLANMCLSDFWLPVAGETCNSAPETYRGAGTSVPASSESLTRGRRLPIRWSRSSEQGSVSAPEARRHTSK